jgi:hypothetical protein
MAIYEWLQMQDPNFYHYGISCQNGTNASVWSGIMLQNDTLGGSKSYM